MICLDANVFLRALIPPVSENDRGKHRQAVAVFQAASAGEMSLTATDVVLHEVLYILTLLPAKNGYGLSPGEAVDRLQALVVLPGFIHPRKAILLGTLRLWRERPALGFSDALTTTLAREDQLQLMTFDAHFDALDDIDRYRPAA